ncbi:hypothetical protein Dsin_029479 [Dipteronia sinensis]|uniref:Reverse transcriptase domain-containing protein n=1 Tax=Dipteronia sinensis TaxID=43782 RepID=A0AAD9ZSN6_9ROSI|nr:hypothetical protein Dsin_029479 [Dipteronia sinensis]
MGDFRPISLVGAMYKVLAKVLANRMRNVMQSVIGDYQIAFIKNRQILDSFVIAEEVIHKWKTEKDGGLLVKLDFEKAYDSVDHTFVDNMLEYGLQLEMKALDQGVYIVSVSFGVGLSSLIQKANNMGFIKGEVFGNNGVQVTHLQFVDDTVIFLKPRVDYLLNLKRIIRCFELSSKLKINFHKSYVVRVGKNVTHENSWADIFRCRKAALPITYLGIPLGARPYSKVFWNPVVDKIETRLRPWKRKFLSKSDYGDWIGNVWQWKMELRRGLFSWEISQWHCFLRYIECLKIRQSTKDTIGWGFNTNGVFTVLSFHTALEEVDGRTSLSFRNPWKGICPPKVELFTWQLLRGRVFVGEVL